MSRRWLYVLLLAPSLALAAGAAKPVDPVFAHAAEASELTQMLAPVTRQLSGAAGLQGEFTQQNFLHELPRPLTSSGTFLVSRGLGVDWHTLQPFDAEVVLTPQALIQRSGGNSETLGADQQAGLGAVARTFDALFTLDLPQLTRRFTLYGVQGADRWTLGLKPRDAALATHLSAVVVTGSDRPSQVTLYQASGDRTEIRFAHVRVMQKLTTVQRQRLSP